MNWFAIVFWAGVVTILAIQVEMWLNGGRKRHAAPKPPQQKPPEPPKPRQWEPPTDLTGEQMEWLRAQMDLAGQPMPKPPPPRKVSLVNPYRKPSSGEYVTERTISDRRARYYRI